MAKETLHDQLSELHETLQHTTAVSPETKTLLKELATDIQQMIDSPEPINSDSLADRLEESLAVFEADHPQLTTLMQTIISSLSNMGL